MPLRRPISAQSMTAIYCWAFGSQTSKVLKARFSRWGSGSPPSGLVCLTNRVSADPISSGLCS